MLILSRPSRKKKVTGPAISRLPGIGPHLSRLVWLVCLPDEQREGAEHYGRHASGDGSQTVLIQQESADLTGSTLCRRDWNDIGGLL